MENRDNFICTKCIHFRLISGGCDAFIIDIPNEILMANSHDIPIENQGNDIVFEEGDPQFS